MCGFTESLNVSVAAALVLQRLLDRRDASGAPFGAPPATRG